jgi:hypothetical protein
MRACVPDLAADASTSGSSDASAACMARCKPRDVRLPDLRQCRGREVMRAGRHRPTVVPVLLSPCGAILKFLS